MTKRRLLLLLVSVVNLIAISCKKDKGAVPGDVEGSRDKIVFNEVNATFTLDQAASTYIDLNSDGVKDFQFYTSRFTTDMDELEGFLVKSLGGSKMTVINLSDNPIFNSMNLLSYSSNEEISASLPAEYSWKSTNGLLAMRHISNSISYIARWSDGVTKTMAVSVTMNGKVNYGWIKLRYSRENNNMTILSYAYNQSPGQPIQVGQIQ